MIARTIHRILQRTVANRRPPDYVIGGEQDPYLRRWWVIPRNRFFNVYLHHFCRSDDDRALHDHPWWNMSLLLSGNYREHLVGGVVKRRTEGAFYFRRASTAHRVELEEEFPHSGMHIERPVWTLFVTGPRIREWGFLCPHGWRHWREFTNPTDDGRTRGKGCD